MRSLRFRLTLWFSLAVTLTACAAAWIGRSVVQQQMIEGIDFLLSAENQEIVERLGEDPRTLSDQQVVELITKHTEIDAPAYYFQIHRVGNGIIFRSHNLGDDALPDLTFAETLTQTILLRDEPMRVRELHYGDFHLQVATSLTQVDALLDQFRHAILLGIPVLFATSIGIGVLLSRFALGPVRAMQRSAQEIGASNLSQRLPVPVGHDEITDLARLLNDLFARLEVSFEQVKRFTADASHELRTPLSLIRLHAERILKSPGLDEASRAEIEEQLEEIARMNTLIEQLLMLAQADAGGLHLERRTYGSAQFIADFFEDATTLAEECGLRVAVAANVDGEVSCDPGMMRQVLLNILSNALRHTPSGRTIRLASTIANGEWRIVIEDEGPGVAPEMLERMFVRFVRGPGSARGSTGLGLAIVRSIVEAHAGTIRAENLSPHGLRVIVVVPDARAAASVQPTAATP